MTQWHFPPELNIPPDLLDFVGNPILARLLCQRGVNTAAQARLFLDPQSYQPASAYDLPDLDLAVRRLQQAIQRQEVICVWGDFDVDGQTSTTLLVSVLQHLGAKVMYYIPDRMTESHGMKRPAVERIIAQGVNLILTCDTGIAEHDPIGMAQAQGVDVIVTDHHDLAETLPPAMAAINPKRLDPTHPLRELPGVGVAYKLAEALTSTEWAEGLLDLVALGIVADVARQTGDTRYLLQRGLPVLTATPRLGLQLLLENSGLKVDHLTEEHIGFWLGPRLNALGRLGNANLAVELLTTRDLNRGRMLAMQIEGMNDQRKLLVEQVTAAALVQIEQTPTLAEYNALVLAGHNWHPGVIGIAANRLVEQFNKPTILIALSPGATGDESRPKMMGSGAFVGGNLKGSLIGRGSARSVAGCDIHEAIKTQADLLLGFGGHPMAAGLSLPVDNISAFRRGLSEALAGCQAHHEKVITVDAVVTLAEADLPLLETIQRLAPFGQGNPPILLACRDVELVSETFFGKQSGHKHVILRDKAGTEREFLWWQGAKENTPTGLFDVAFKLGHDNFHGGGGVQLEWRGARQEGAPIAISTKPVLIDWRQEYNVEAKLAAAQLDMIWGEGVTAAGVTLLNRQELMPSSHLVIWTAPPNDQVYQDALKWVQPRHIYLIGRAAPFDSLQPFVRQLMGLVKYILQQKGGQIEWERLMAALGHGLGTVQLGLDWLVAQGKLRYEVKMDEVHLSAADNPSDPVAVTKTEQKLKAALIETAAYRQFFMNMFGKK